MQIQHRRREILAEGIHKAAHGDASRFFLIELNPTVSVRSQFTTLGQLRENAGHTQAIGLWSEPCSPAFLGDAKSCIKGIHLQSGLQRDGTAIIRCKRAATSNDTPPSSCTVHAQTKPLVSCDQTACSCQQTGFSALPPPKRASNRCFHGRRKESTSKMQRLEVLSTWTP